MFLILSNSLALRARPTNQTDSIRLNEWWRRRWQRSSSTSRAAASYRFVVSYTPRVFHQIWLPSGHCLSKIGSQLWPRFRANHMAAVAANEGLHIVQARTRRPGGLGARCSASQLTFVWRQAHWRFASCSRDWALVGSHISGQRAASCLYARPH